MTKLTSILFFLIISFLFCACQKETISIKKPFFPFTNITQPILEINETISDSLDITPYLQIFENKNEAYDSKDTNEQNNQWKNYNDVISQRFHNNKKTCWFRFSVLNKQQNNYKGLLSFSNLDIVSVYDSSGRIRKAGELVPLKEWSYADDNHCIILTLDSLKAKTYYIECYKQAAPIRHPVKFSLRSEQNAKNFQLFEIKSRMADTVFLFFYLGFLFFCFIYFFIQSFYRTNEKILLLTYCLYIFFTLLYSFRDIDKHYFLQTTFPVFNGINIWSEGIFSYLSYIFYMLFVVYLLDLKNKSKWAYRLIMIVAGTLALFLLGDIILRMGGYDETALKIFRKSRMLLFPLVFLYFTLLIPLRRKYDKGNSYYKYFIIGSIFLVVGTGINLLIFLIRDSPSFIFHDAISSKYGFWGNTVNYTRLGIIIEIVFFSLGLSKKMRLDYTDAVISEESDIENRFFVHETRSALTSLKSRLGPQEDAKKYLKLFRNYLTNALKSMKYKQGIELSEEIAMIKSYFTMRREDDKSFEFIFNNKMNIQMDNIIVPAALLIPFVQNFFDHAAVEINDMNTLTVTVHEKNGRVNLDLSDNGRGLEKVNEEKRSSSSGLDIARRKIALFNYRHGTRVGFKIKNNETSKGALITISNLPKRNII